MGLLFLHQIGWCDGSCIKNRIYVLVTVIGTVVPSSNVILPPVTAPVPASTVRFSEVTVDPAGPVGPVAPAAPVEPVAPSAPVGPVAPAAPVGPVAPAAPVGPVEPFIYAQH